MPRSSLIEVEVEVGVGDEVEVGRWSLDGVRILFRSGVGGKMN